jgi:hypothetical protein
VRPEKGREVKSKWGTITATVKRPNTAPDAPRLIVVAERRKRLARFEHTCRAPLGVRRLFVDKQG